MVNRLTLSLTTFWGLGRGQTVFSYDTPTAGVLGYIIDGDFSADSNCLTMEGDKPYVTIDYGSVIPMNTIFVLGASTVSEVGNLGDV